MPDASPTPAKAALQGLCPRCGAKSLFGSLAGFAPKCRACGLYFASFNVGDGPAAFLILIIGAGITALAILFELSVQPPFWVHIVLWLPLTIAAVILSLRWAKAALLGLGYRNSAREGRIMDQ